MVGLLGHRDEHLRAIESVVPGRRPSTCAATRSPSRAATPTEVGRPLRGARPAAPAGPEPRQRQPGPRRSTWCGPTSGRARCSPPRSCAPPGAARCARRPRARSATSTPSAATSSPSASGPPAPARAGWPWPWPCRRCRPSRWSASSSPGRRSRPASGSASCPATSWPRSIPTSARSTTRSTTWSSPRAPSACSSARPSRSRRWPSCGAGRSTAASSSSTRPRTPRPSR